MTDREDITQPPGEERGGREATIEKILDAAEALFAARDFSAVTVRNIAERAGVSHALVHRYLGSKEEIFRATLARSEKVILRAAAGTDDLIEAASQMIREGLAHRQDYLRLVTHSALSNVGFETTIRHFVATERLIELAERRAGVTAGGLDPEDVNVRLSTLFAVALFLGWVAIGDWLLHVGQLKDVDDDVVQRELEAAVIQLLERIPRAGQGGEPSG